MKSLTSDELRSAEGSIGPLLVVAAILLIAGGAALAYCTGGDGNRC